MSFRQPHQDKSLLLIWGKQFRFGSSEKMPQHEQKASWVVIFSVALKCNALRKHKNQKYN